MKGEGVAPGNVVYTAALAECRWAGQAKHVEYLLQRMEAEGMSIVPGMGTHILGVGAAIYTCSGSSCVQTLHFVPTGRMLADCKKKHLAKVQFRKVLIEIKDFSEKGRCVEIWFP